MRYMIREVDIFRLILEELNNNILGVPFQLSNVRENVNGFYIERLSFNTEDNNFNIDTTFDEETYNTTTSYITPMSISSLNTELLSHNSINSAQYSPLLRFIIPNDNIMLRQGNLETINQIRERLIQYQRPFEIEMLDLENTSSTTKIKKTYNVAMASGEIDYGTIEEINGKTYLIVSMPLNIFVSEKGEFANQQKFIFNDILEDYISEIKPLTWLYGKQVETSDYQVLNSKNALNNTIKKQVESIPTNNAFSLVITFQMEFDDPILFDFYKWSLEETSEPKNYIVEIETLNRQGVRIHYVRREMLLTDVRPVEDLSQGEVIEYIATFVPAYKGV